MNWVIETERWNWNDIDEPGPENNSNKYWRLGKKICLKTKTFIVHKGGNSKHLYSHVSFRLWTTNYPDRKGKCIEILFLQYSLSLQDQQMMPKIAWIIYEAFNRPVLSLQDASMLDTPTVIRGAVPYLLPSSLMASHASKANIWRIQHAWIQNRRKIREQPLWLLGARHQVESFFSNCNCFTAKFLRETQDKSLLWDFRNVGRGKNVL